MNVSILEGSVIYSKTPSFGVELHFSNHIIALPTPLLQSAEWSKSNTQEQVVCRWAGLVVTFYGHRLQSLPGCLIRCEVSTITEVSQHEVDIVQMPVITSIVVNTPHTPQYGN